MSQAPQLPSHAKRAFAACDAAIQLAVKAGADEAIANVWRQAARRLSRIGQARMIPRSDGR